MPRILVTGDRPLIRTALSLLISTENISVIGECANDPDAIAAAVAAQPDVVVMDLDLEPRCIPAAEPERLAQIIRAAKGCPVLIVTAREDPQAIRCALQHGVLGIVVKTRKADVLLQAIRGIASGQAWLEPSVVARILQKDSGRDTEDTVPVGNLTRRESEVVELVSLGLQNKKIAERLCISETTVRHHLTSIYDKLSVANRLELMHYTYRGRIAVA